MKAWDERGSSVYRNEVISKKKPNADIQRTKPAKYKTEGELRQMLVNNYNLPQKKKFGVNSNLS